MKKLVRKFVTSLPGAVLVCLIAGPAPAAYAEAAEAAEVRTLHESWYLRYKEPLKETLGEDLSCRTPLGCNLAGNAVRPAPPASYPDDTLHVATNTGEPDAQTYLSFDLSQTLQNTVVTGGTITLVAAPATSGTFNETNADMVACLVTEPFVSVQSGSWTSRPNYDPNICSPLVRVSGAHPATWRAHLAPLGAKWSADANYDGVADVPNYGITILPNPKVAPGTPMATWKIAFDSRRNISGTPIISTLTYRVLAKPRDTQSPLAEHLSAAPPLAPGQTSPEIASAPSLSSNNTSEQSVLASPVLAPSVASPSPLSSSVLGPQLAPDAGRNITRGMLPVVAATSGSRSGHQAVWFAVLLNGGIAGLLAWSLARQAQLGSNSATENIRGSRNSCACEPKISAVPKAEE